MSELTRFGVSIEGTLLKEFDQLIKKKGYANRSEAIRDIIRESLIAEDVTHPDIRGTGTINIVFNHHKAHLSDKLTHLQHDSKLHIYSTTHIHLDKELCLEIIVLSGKLAEIRTFGDQIAALKGVLNSQTFLFGTEKI